MMGNCAHTRKYQTSVRMVTDSGHILYFGSLQLVQDILHKFPGYGVFRNSNFSSPLPGHERLVSGGLYYLLALGNAPDFKSSREALDVGCSRSPAKGRLSSGAASDISDTAIEVLPSTDGGVWKVKFVLGTKELEDILSEQVNTEALIEKMREAAAMARSSPRQTKNGRGLNWKSQMFYKKRSRSIKLQGPCLGVEQQSSSFG